MEPHYSTTNMRNFLLTTFSICFATLCFSQKSLTVGQRITGDFNGDGRMDTAFVKQTKNPKTKVKEWTLYSSDKSIPPIGLGCCDVYLVDEGDLNADKTTEISVFQAPQNGCTYTGTTFTYKAGQWKKLVPMFLVPTYCEPFTAANLQKKVFTENGNVFYWDIDPKNEKGRPLKKQVSIK
jgi:hypothetical protein